MNGIQSRNWTGPDGVRYRLSVTERLINDQYQLRRTRRLEFADADGVVVGDAAVPGYFALDLASSLELEELWRWAVGK